MITKINNIQIDDAKYNNVDNNVLKYGLIEYNDNYSKTSESLWQYQRDDANDDIMDFESFKYKVKITGKNTAGCNTKNDETVVPLKHLSNFWVNVEMLLINWELDLCQLGEQIVLFFLELEQTNFQ